MVSYLFQPSRLALIIQHFRRPKPTELTNPVAFTICRRLSPAEETGSVARSLAWQTGTKQFSGSTSYGIQTAFATTDVCRI